MKILKLVVTNPILILLVLMKDLFDIIKELLIFNISKMNIDYYEIIIKLLLATLIMILFRQFYKLKEQSEYLIKQSKTLIDQNSIINLIMKIRLNNNVLNAYKGTDKFLNDRINKTLNSELEEVKTKMRLSFPDKSEKELVKLINEFYNEHN